MRFICQSNFPLLWLFLQKTIGGNQSKQRLATQHYKGENRVLEVGCSVGNISEVFTAFSNIIYTGIDIDPVAIQTARKRFKSFHNFSFQDCSIYELANTDLKYDYVLFAGILHHVQNEECIKLLSTAMKLVTNNGLVVISEPEALKASDNIVFKLFYKIEQGSFLRSRFELEKLVQSVNAKIESSEDCLISLWPFKNFFVARFSLISLRVN